MFDKELIKGQEVLQDLTDEQVGAIVTLAQNKEKEIADRVTGKVHGFYDQNFQDILGVEKPNGVFSSDFWKEQVAGLKEKAAKAGDNTEVEKLRTTISSLEKQIKEGAGDNALVSRLEQDLEDTRQQFGQLKEMKQKELNEWQEKYNQLNSRTRQAEVKAELTGFKLRDDLPESLRNLAIENAVAKVASYKEEKDAEGNTIFRDQSGKLLTNPENGLAPYTRKELLQKELKEVIAEGKKANGTGTKPPAGGPKMSGDVVQVGQVRSRMEADEAIKTALQDMGIAVTDPKYHEIKKKTWEEVVKPMNLPLR